MKKSISVEFSICDLDDLMRNLNELEAEGISSYMPIKSINMGEDGCVSMTFEEKE